MGLLGSFLGSDQRKDVTNAYNKSNQYLDQGYNSANTDYTTAINNYSPYTQSGQQANAFYSNMLGLNGADAANSAWDTLSSNPLFTGQLASNSNAVSRTLNAQGSSGGGKAQLAAQRVLQGNALNFANLYAGLGQQGLSATQAQGNALMGRGDMTTNYYGTKAGNAVNYGNALASSRTQGVNNLLNLGGLAVSAYTGGMPTGLKKTA